jgi:hypothetical protein
LFLRQPFLVFLCFSFGLKRCRDTDARLFFFFFFWRFQTNERTKRM